MPTMAFEHAQRDVTGLMNPVMRVRPHASLSPESIHQSGSRHVRIVHFRTWGEQFAWRFAPERGWFRTCL